MSIEFLSSSAAGGGPSIVLSVTVTKPTGVVTGDLMIAHFTIDGRTDNGDTPPADWTKFIPFTGGGDGIVDLTYWKIATATEPTGYTFTHDGNPHLSPGQVDIVAYRGADQTAPIDASGTSNIHLDPFDEYTAELTASSGRVVRLTIENISGDDWDMLFHPVLIKAAAGPPRLVLLAARFGNSGDVLNAIAPAVERLHSGFGPRSWAFESGRELRSFVRGGQFQTGGVRGGQVPPGLTRGLARAGQEPR